MAAIEPTRAVSSPGCPNSDAQWRNWFRAWLANCGIVLAEIFLAELGIRELIQQEVDCSLKIAIALGFLLRSVVLRSKRCSYGPICSAGSSLGAFALVAAISGLATVGRSCGRDAVPRQCRSVR
jgi:hypothetical protein